MALDDVKKISDAGKEKGYLTYHEVDDPIPHNVHSLEDLDDLLTTIGTQGIDVLEDQQKLPSSALKKEFEEEVEPSEDIVLDLPPGALEKTNDLVRIYLFQQPDNGHSGDCGRTQESPMELWRLLR